MRPLLLAAALCALLAPLGSELPAQQLRPGLLVGRVTDPSGASVADAVLRATQGARTIIVEADEDGDFRITGLAGGTWTIAIRRLGYRPLAADILMPAEGLRRDFTLETTTAMLDPQLIAARWTGVRGVVGDARRITPLAGARVRLLGSDAMASSDSLGNFALQVPGGRDIVLRVERTGFASRLVSLTVPPDSYLDLDVALDTTLSAPKDALLYRDLDQRLKYATPRAVQVSREEIEGTDAVSLGTALGLTPSVTERGVAIGRGACVFVNGVARPGFPVDAILAGEVEFVEVYPPGSELTRTLSLRWPARAACGTGTVRTAGGVAARQTAQFVSVWLKAP
ncbi:MAG: carboxypeptidase regulatory-like domain-containing protein [Gemmatimonadetes bacterium]|nr:carboxypeptidase regulatory-like domain-containing protein [Gemmatimonadota bacterium]